MRKERIPELLAEIKDELNRLDILVADICDTGREIPALFREERIYKESLALKLHNFYTGCEKLFRKIADDVNGGVPRTLDWHKRLLKTMSLEIEGIRPLVISEETMTALDEYLAFRHVVRNIYGFQIEREKIDRLIRDLPEIYGKFKQEIERFLDFLREVLK